MWRIATVVLLAACNQDQAPVVESSSTSKPTGKDGGFSADLAKQIGSGSDMMGIMGSAASGSSGSSGSGASGSAAESAGSGSAVAAGSGSAKAPAAGSGSAKPTIAAGSAKDPKDPKDPKAPKEPAAGSAKAPVVAAGSAKPPAAGSGSAKPLAAGSGSAKPPAVPAAGSGTAKTANTNTPLSRDPVKPPAELAAIKISLLPNWERDIGEAGTLSFPVKTPSGDTRVFVFRYGIEDAAAPADREQYKKWLSDTKRLNVSSDRQRGAAWTLEGSDGSGAGAFRYLINFGGKKLICYGSLYKDAVSSKLGDLRDQTILQAKQICETLAL